MKRVDNFGAGFLRTGAKAVFASGITSVSFYLRALFTGSRSMTFKQMFYADPSRTMSANFGFYSSRTAGATGSIDPELTRQVLPLGGRLDQHHDRGLARLSPPSACSASPHRSSTPGPTAGRRAVPRQPASSSHDRSSAGAAERGLRRRREWVGDRGGAPRVDGAPVRADALQVGGDAPDGLHEGRVVDRLA